MLPWNKFTYPFIVVLVAFKEARGLAKYIRGTLKTDFRKRSRNGTKWFFKLIFDHIYWSLNVFKKTNLPKETLRRIVKIKDTDASLKISHKQTLTLPNHNKPGNTYRDSFFIFYVY